MHAANFAHVISFTRPLTSHGFFSLTLIVGEGSGRPGDEANESAHSGNECFHKTAQNKLWSKHQAHSGMIIII